MYSIFIKVFPGNLKPLVLQHVNTNLSNEIKYLSDNFKVYVLNLTEKTSFDLQNKNVFMDLHTLKFIWNSINRSMLLKKKMSHKYFD